jgi:2-polyprenyl-3-methyl-5-hydroxy-6-metoxy-1,4-benzoquinol methylase
MLDILKSLVIENLARAGFRLHRMPKLNYRMNPAVNELGVDEIMRIVKEETSKNPHVPPTWADAKRYLHPRRLSAYCDAVDLVEQHGVAVADRRVLDVGAFFGVLLRDVHRRFPTAKLCGTECWSTGLAVARRVCPQADLRAETIAELSFDGQFDLVVLMEVLEHLVDPGAELQRIDRIVAPGGSLFVTVPNGRFDLTGADEFDATRQSYRGHINFWSPENWPLFLNRQLPERTVLTGPFPPKCLFALIRKT